MCSLAIYRAGNRACGLPGAPGGKVPAVVSVAVAGACGAVAAVGRSGFGAGAGRGDAGSGVGTTGVREPLALGPGNALYAAAWWRFAVRTGGAVAFDGMGAIAGAWPFVDTAPPVGSFVVGSSVGAVAL